MKINYTQLAIPLDKIIEPCPVCGSEATLWEHIAEDGDIQKVVMCSHDDAIGPFGAEGFEGCPLYMPPDDFYWATVREAISYWNDFANRTNMLRRRNNWITTNKSSEPEQRLKTETTESVSSSTKPTFCKPLGAENPKVTVVPNGTSQFLVVKTEEDSFSFSFSYRMYHGETKATSLQRIIEEFDLRAAHMKKHADWLRIAQLALN